MGSIADAKLLVRGLLEQCNYASHQLIDRHLRPYLIALDDLPRAIVATALLEECLCENQIERIAAARLFLYLYEGDENAKSAIQVFRVALESDSEEIILTAYDALRDLSSVPTELYPIVEKHFFANQEYLSHLIPSVAISVPDLRHAAIGRILDRVKNDECDPIDRIMAAIDLIREGYQADRAWQAIFEIAKDAEKDNVYFFLSKMIGRVGSPSEIGSRLLADAYNDSEIKMETRNRLIPVLGAMAEHSPSIFRIILEILGSNDADSIRLTSDCLTRCKRALPRECIDVLVGRLSASKTSIRNAAATSLLCCCTSIGKDAALIIVQRMGIERDIVVLETLAKIASREGASVIQPLLALAEEDSTFRNWIAIFTLTSAGERAQADLLRVIAENPTMESSRVFASVLSALRITSGFDPIRSALVHSDPEVVANLLISISRVGHEAELLTPILLEFAVTTDDIRSSLACKAIESIGPIALSHFGSFERLHPDHPTLNQLRLRIENQGLVDGMQDDLRWISKPIWIRTFVHVVNLLDELGPVGFKRMAKELRERKAKGLIEDDVSLGESKLRKVIDDLEKEISNRYRRLVLLLHSSDNRSGGLTSDGERFALKARAYVRSMKM